MSNVLVACQGGAAPADLASAFRTAFERARRMQSAAPHAQLSLDAVAAACRDVLADRWAATQEADARRAGRRVHYLSMEFLMGCAAGNALAALGIGEAVRKAAGTDAGLEEILDREPDAALGNGGLGRLAACFLDAFATLRLPSFGYGLRYEYGMFAQSFGADGRQLEHADDWQANGNFWELPRPDVRYPVGFGGHVRVAGARRTWRPAESLIAQAFDFIVPGHGTERVSTLRLWKARAAAPIDYATFCRGEHAAAGRQLLEAQALNWVLYPDDSTDAGRELRLRQEYLLVSASIQDMLARHLREHGRAAGFGRRNAVHLNDTHPALAPLELMRLLVDEHGLDWEEAWRATSEAMSYTNHTLMPEALESWPASLLASLLPRHHEIAVEIDARLADEVRHRFPGDEGRVARLRLFDASGGEPRLRMGSLCIAASRRVNGVSALHSRLMTQTLFREHAQMWPGRFLNVTNGVTPRRWLAQANPGLSSLLDSAIGTGWRKDFGAIGELGARAGDRRLGEALHEVKRANKRRLARRIDRELGLAVDPDSLFDVQVKRIHEYKRQLLNALQVVARYHAILAEPNREWTPRTVIFAGKAASAYRPAKAIIHLLNDVAAVVNSDPRVDARLKVAFIPNYGVSLAELIIPAADLSEQISTAGTEASGTGNMKFAMNGALTIGTWDGANIEMAEAVGADRFFIFGLRTEEVARHKAEGYDARRAVAADPALAAALEGVARGEFSPGERDRHRPLVEALLAHDPYLVTADFTDYLRAQARADALFRDPATWAEWALANIAGMGFFSIDRAAAEYDRLVWNPPEGT